MITPRHIKRCNYLHRHSTPYSVTEKYEKTDELALKGLKMSEEETFAPL